MSARESTMPADLSRDAQPTPLVDLLSALHRLLKVARMYDKDNQALSSSAEAVVLATSTYCAMQVADSLDVTFADETVFVNGRMVRMPREVYARVMELGAVLAHSEIANLSVSRTVTVQNLVAFVQALGAAYKDPARKAAVAAPAYGGIRARQLRFRTQLQGDLDLPPIARVVRTYASAVVAVRRALADVARMPAGQTAVLRRLAQRIVAHAETEPSVLVALASAQGTGNDAASLAVTTTLVAVLMGQKLTDDRDALTDLALAGLGHDLGHRRLRALGSDSPALFHESPLSEDELDRIPASGAVLAVTVGPISDLTIPKSVIAFEAQWVARAARLGPLYAGKRQPVVLARILAVARAFSRLLAPGSYEAHLAPEGALAALDASATDESDRLYVRLLTAGLGIFPVGTTVELSTGETALVVAVPERSVDFARPPVRVMTDRAGGIVREPFDVDLALPVEAGEERRAIRRAVETDPQQARLMRDAILAKRTRPVGAAAPPTTAPAVIAKPAPVRPEPPRAPEAPRSRPTINPAPLRPLTKRPTVHPAAPRSTEVGRVRSTISPGALRPQDALGHGDRPSSLPGADLGAEAQAREPASVIPEPASSSSRLPPSSTAGRTRYVMKQGADVQIPAAPRPPVVSIPTFDDGGDTLKTVKAAEAAPELPLPPPADDVLEDPLGVTAPDGVPVFRPDISFSHPREPQDLTRPVDWRSYGDVVAEATPAAKPPSDGAAKVTESGADDDDDGP